MTPGAAGKRFRAVLAALVLAVLATHVIVIASTAKIHPDEVLAPALLRQLDRSWDTNWKHAGLPPGVHAGDQYNFSGYYIALHAFARAAHVLPASILPESPMRTLRIFSALCAAAALVVVALVTRGEAGASAALFAVLLTALSPGLVMDGLYARPDSFVTLLSLALLIVYLRRSRLGRVWIVVAGLLVGFLVATKVSAVVYGLLLVPAAVATRPGERPRPSASGALLAALATLAGFAAGAPGALAHPAEFATGVEALRRQYTGEFAPHGLGADAPVLARALNGAEWLAQTWGLALVLAGVGLASLVRERRWDLLFALSPFAITLAWFMTTPVFFERNLAPGIAALAVVAGIGLAAVGAWLGRRLDKPWLSRSAATFAGALALLAPAAVSAKVLQSMYDRLDIKEELMAVLRQHHRDVLVVGWNRPPWDGIRVGDTACDPPIVQVHHAGDRKTLAWLEEGRARGWVPLKRIPSRFEGYVASTFHTYLSADFVWLAKPGAAGTAAGAGGCAIRWE
jgi:hypothetical protein